MRLTLAALLIALLPLGGVYAVELSLDDGWTFRPDPSDQGRGQMWFARQQPANFVPIAVGQSWESQGYPYDGYAWYRCGFELPVNAKGSAITLRFEAVDEVANIWLNGMFVTTMDVGWNNPLEMDITDYVVFDRENVLAVRIFDSARQGGIWKPVTLHYNPVDSAAMPECVNRLRRESVRALSAPVGHPSQASRYVNGRMNLCVSWAYMLNNVEPYIAPPGEDFINRDILAEGTIGRYYSEARTAKENDLLYMPALWVHNDTLPYLINSTYRRSVDCYGRQQTITPCPQSAEYWQKMTLPQMRILAEIQAEIGCQGGVCLDLEWYAGDFSGGFCYDPLAVQGCYCDVCFGGFMESIGQDGLAMALADRGDYIRTQGLWETYLLHLETRVAQQARSVCRELREIKPDILFGMLPGVAGARYDGIENWFTRGVVRGMALDGIPSLLFSETEYETGFCDRTKTQLDWLEDNGVPGMIVGGLTIGYFSGQGIGAKAAELAQLADGYWFYHGTSLLHPEIPATTERSEQSAHTLREPLERYWTAIRTANLWLDEQAAMPALAVSSREPLFTSETVSSVSPGITFSPNTVAFAPAGTVASNLLVNGDFTQPFDMGWSTFDVPPIIADSEHGNMLVYDFGQRPDDQGYSSCYQNLQLQPNTRYQLDAGVITSNLQGPRRVAAHVCSYKSPSTLLSPQLRMGAEDGIMHQLTGLFTTGDDGRVTVMLLANGHGGQIAFGQVQILPVEQMEMITNPKTGVDAVTMPQSETINCKWDLLNPQTGVRYFGKLQETADLRYLNMLYPECSYQFELEATVPALQSATELGQPIMINAQ